MKLFKLGTILAAISNDKRDWESKKIAENKNTLLKPLDLDPNLIYKPPTTLHLIVDEIQHSGKEHSKSICKTLLEQPNFTMFFFPTISSEICTEKTKEIRLEVFDFKTSKKLIDNVVFIPNQKFLNPLISFCDGFPKALNLLAQILIEDSSNPQIIFRKLIDRMKTLTNIPNEWLTENSYSNWIISIAGITQSSFAFIFPFRHVDKHSERKSLRFVESPLLLARISLDFLAGQPGVKEAQEMIDEMCFSQLKSKSDFSMIFLKYFANKFLVASLIRDSLKISGDELIPSIIFKRNFGKVKFSRHPSESIEVRKILNESELETILLNEESQNNLTQLNVKRQAMGFQFTEKRMENKINTVLKLPFYKAHENSQSPKDLPEDCLLWIDCIICSDSKKPEILEKDLCESLENYKLLRKRFPKQRCFLVILSNLLCSDALKRKIDVFQKSSRQTDFPQDIGLATDDLIVKEIRYELHGHGEQFHVEKYEENRWSLIFGKTNSNLLRYLCENC